MRNTFNRKEVIELIRFYCEHQRILCQLPVCSPREMHLTPEMNGIICDAIRIKADLEKLWPLDKEDFGWRLKDIRADKKQNS